MNSTSDITSERPTDLAVNYPSQVPIDIFRNSVWAGSGYLKEGRIVNCYAAQLGKSGLETEAIYEAIERAIAAGESTLRWSIDDKMIFTWRLGTESY